MSSNQSPNVPKWLPILRELLLDRIELLESSGIAVEQDPKLGKLLIMAQEFLAEHEQAELWLMIGLTVEQRRSSIGQYLLAALYAISKSEIK